MSSNDLTRVRYTPRQFLGAQDFTDEQAYHLAMHRRHNIAHHTWGIVRGLELIVEDQENLFVQPGYGVDGFGRDLVLPQRQSVSLTAFDDKGRDALDVFLVYNRMGNDTTMPNACNDDEGTNPNRWREFASVEIRRADPDRDFRTDPPDVTDADLQFGAQSSPPDDPLRRWLVFLGRFVRRRGQDRRYTYQAVLDNRPYAGLIGESILAPWDNGTRVELGGALADDAHFAVRFRNATPAFEVQKDGTTIIRGQTTINGEATLNAGGLRFDQPGTDPDSSNWGIYRIRPAPSSSGDAEAAERLHVTMGNSGASERAVVIGAWDTEKNFHPCLTVSDDGTVAVHGNLVVEGDLVSATTSGVPARISQRLSEQNLRMREMAFNAGLSGAAGVLQFIAIRSALNVLISQRANIIAAAKNDDDLRKQLRSAFKSILDDLKQDEG